MPEAAAAFARVMGRPVEYVQVDIEETRKASADWAEMLEWFDRAGYKADIPHLRRPHPGLLTLDQWIRESKWAPVGAGRAAGSASH